MDRDVVERRLTLEVRAVVVGWRDVMTDIHAGLIGNSRESVGNARIRALSLLEVIEANHAGDAPDVSQVLAKLVADARAEIQGATFHDLADSGEAAG